MNIKKFERIVCISSLILIMLLSSIGLVYATTTDELKNQQKDLDSQISKTKKEIENIKEEMSANLKEINNLLGEISNTQNEIDELQVRIDNVSIEIGIKEAELAVQQEKYVSQKDAFEKRLVAMYETGTTTYLDMLLSSESLSDFISNYFIISQLAEYDEELLGKIEETKNKISAENEYLKSAREEIKLAQADMASKKSSLSTSVNKKNALVTNLSEEEKKKQEELEQFEKDKREIQAELAKIASKYTGAVIAPSAAGYTSPLAGKTKANITTQYMAYKNHTGVDFACPAGTPIYAVKAGTVVTSKALKSGNKYKSYGEYIVIDHHDGTMTLYAHMSPGSRLVQVNDSVSQGQQIGSVGTTGNSSGNHLHFEVRVGGKYQNPNPYLP